MYLRQLFHLKAMFCILHLAVFTFLSSYWSSSIGETVEKTRLDVIDAGASSRSPKTTFNTDNVKLFAPIRHLWALRLPHTPTSTPTATE